MIFPAVVVLSAQLGWPGTSPALGDLEFTRAVEETVMAWSGAGPPEPFAKLIGELGSGRFRVREEATKALQEAARPDPRWLFWGRARRDPEVRVRCNAVLRRVCPCPTCGGSGTSRYYAGSACWDCEGLGSIWPWSAWD